VKGRTVFAIVGWGMLGLTFLSFLLHALWQIKTGSEWGYLTARHQPMTYLGALATFGLVGMVALVMLYYWLKAFIQRRRKK